MDLIYAEATPPGRGGVSIVRISGNGCRAVAEGLVGSLPQPRHAYVRAIRDETGLVDQALVLWFECGQSFTGEETVELHLHGAPVIVRRVGHLLADQGVRLAEAGEFTRRAFLNGRMDLSEIEGLGDLLAAETESQRRLALRTSTGELSRMAEHWRSLLIRAGALVESSVDFADEDVPDEISGEVFDLLEQFESELTAQISGYAAAERIRSGFEVAIIGPPNVGKSSLLNRIAQRDVAIVSDIAGTTRDIIELRIDLKGLAVSLLDTAGLREAKDSIEEIGVDRARRRAAAADLRIHLATDGTIDASLWQAGDLDVRGKVDLTGGGPGLGISAVTGTGLEQLLDTVFDTLSVRTANAALVSHERQVNALIEARSAVVVAKNMPAELVAESIRQAAASLDRLLGRIGAEDYLDVIFASFCIGK